MNSYQKNKEIARELAKDLYDSFWDSERYHSWEAIVEFQSTLIAIGKPYGLLKEFHENGLC